jgi:hypothetical protein
MKRAQQQRPACRPSSSRDRDTKQSSAPLVDIDGQTVVDGTAVPCCCCHKTATVHPSLSDCILVIGHGAAAAVGPMTFLLITILLQDENFDRNALL